MICKSCGAELEEGAVCCPACGAAQEASTDEAIAGLTAAEETEAFERNADAENTAESEAQKQPAKKNDTAWILGCVIAALLAVIFIAIFKISASKMQQTEEPSQQTQVQPGEEGTTEPAGNGISYTVAPDALTDEVLDKVVASCGEDKLTNRELGIFYWQQYYSFASQYGEYAAYIINQDVGFDQQMYDEEQTVQQLFLNSALSFFSNLSAIRQEAEAAGFRLPEDEQANIDSLAASMDAAAKAYGFENGDAYIQSAFGPGVTMKEYQSFVEANSIAGAYLDKLVEEVEYSDEDISAYFDENSETYAMYHILKTDKPNVDIRHILIMPDEDENGEISEQAWSDAEQKINEIVAQWEAGEMTEDAFAALAVEHSMDGSAASGGIYTNVYPGQMVDEFNDWCFADGRQTGDYGLVKTRFGWHLIYFCAEGEEIYWRTMAERDYLNDQAARIQNELVKKYNVETTPENAAIVDVLQLQKEAAQ